MIKVINENAVWVTGAFRSAIYDFATGNVYSINHEGTELLTDYIAGKVVSEKNRDFIFKVNEMVKLDLDSISDYLFPFVEPELHFVWLELTQKCNFRCIHCYQGNEHIESPVPLTVSQWESIISQCAGANCRHIQFIGGEPSVCNFLPRLIEYAHGVGIKEITVFSNLFSMTNALISAITDFHVSVSFSIYGASASAHDLITQTPGSFQRLISRIKQLKELNVPLRANIVLMKENEGEYTPITELLHSLGVTSIHYDEIRKVWGGTQNPHMLTSPKMMRRRPNFHADRKAFSRGNTNTCWFGKFAVSTDGSVYPCEFERGILYGNLRQTSVSDILKGDAVKKYWYFSYDNIIPCQSCEYRFACKDCRPIAYAERGLMTDQNPRCLYNPVTGTWAYE